ncbi:Putative glycosyltransferase EpsE [Candidatus Rubidus massiliensis]|nr:Putative glycosyltransferase EpsE [Candidatus Rubidus massiliensis]
MVKVSILVTSYNHEKYIAQAINSILEQNVSFPFEIVISDDCSTDGTKKILEQYQQKHPHLIYLLPNKENFGITKNLQRSLKACQGEYIAILEGDDYWIAKDKLQKQVDFLDNHPTYSMCFNGLLLYLNDKDIFQHSVPLEKKTYTTQDLIKTNVIGNFSTCMYRKNIVEQLPPSIFETFTVDWMFNMACAQFGPIGCIPLQMTAYRIHSTGVWSSKKPIDNIYQLLDLIPIYDKLLSFKYTSEFKKLVKSLKLRIIKLKLKYYKQLILGN